MSDLAPNETPPTKPILVERVDMLEAKVAHLEVERAALIVNQAQMAHAKASADLQAAKAAIMARYQLSENDVVHPDGRIERVQ
jgi:hypothetical protein